MDPKTGDISSLPVDLIRTVAIVLVIMFHAATEPHPIVTVVDTAEVYRWWTVNIYDSMVRLGVPLFVMLSGALLLHPSKTDEPLGVFFKKRFNRIGLPLIFWTVIYFVWRIVVNKETLTVDAFVQGTLTGPWYLFWFLYMMIGLYLFTPVLRIFVAHSERKLLKYFLTVWFLGVVIVLTFDVFGSYSIDRNLFVIPWWVGYFILGAHLSRARVRPSILFTVFLSGLMTTIIGTYLITLFAGGKYSLYFYDYFSANVILASAALFMLLLTISPDRIKNRFPKASDLLHLVSENTLPIYMLHVIVIDALWKNYLGFTISVNVLNPAYEIPLSTVITLLICLSVIYPLKKIPVLKKLIG